MKRVFKIINEKVLTSLDNVKQKDFTEWFNSIEKMNDIEDLRLLINIAIDIKNDLVDTKTYIKIFDDIEIDGSMKFRNLFENSIKDFNHHIYSKFTNKKKESHKFVRVLNIPTIVEHYYNKSEDIHDKISPNKINIAIGKINVDLKNKEVGFVLSGEAPREVSWVQPLKEFNELINDKNVNRNFAELVYSYSGLHPDYLNDKKKHIGYIMYPVNFAEITYQPCSVNSNWASKNLYMSYERNNENFGRTRTTIDDSVENRRKERVHGKVLLKDEYKYKIMYLGEIENIDIDTKKIVEEALNRL